MTGDEVGLRALLQCDPQLVRERATGTPSRDASALRRR
jgi:hypothetical protein